MTYSQSRQLRRRKRAPHRASREPTNFPVGALREAPWAGVWCTLAGPYFANPVPHLVIGARLDSHKRRLPRNAVAGVAIPAPHSSFRRRPESRGVGRGQCGVAEHYAWRGEGYARSEMRLGVRGSRPPLTTPWATSAASGVAKAHKHRRRGASRSALGWHVMHLSHAPLSHSQPLISSFRRKPESRGVAKMEKPCCAGESFRPTVRQLAVLVNLNGPTKTMGDSREWCLPCL